MEYELKKKRVANPVPGTARAVEVEEIGRIVYDVFDEGLRFIIMRGPASWCAYVGIPKDHPLAGFSYGDIGFINAHGGLTFASEGEKQWPEGYYWYGWDYAHPGDISTHDLKYGGRVSPDEKDWTVEEIITDSRDTLYEFKALMRFSERLVSKR